MEYKTRDNKIEGKDSLQDRFLQAVYGCKLGRFCMKPFVCPKISKAAGRFLSSKASVCLIQPFIESNGISLSDCERSTFRSYNDFFTRKLKKGARSIDSDEAKLVSPCDSKLSVYAIDEELRVLVKHTWYRVEDLLRDKKLAERYKGGYLFLFRLCVDDYHRYIYVDDGIQSSIRRISGFLHTVNPAANDAFPIYKENAREYSLLRSNHFGNILMMEVGAMMVGKIVNYKECCAVKRGEEKGYFEFGGSTVILLFENGRVNPDYDILEHTKQGFETKVRQGEGVGKAVIS